MLQRAASSAYSWWWASHIRTNQSKWLDSNLHEMEDRVQSMLKIIEEDADSFAKRAEMYYKRRPELINFVEETYRAYRALAERYDRISGELHKANHTLATAFPDVEFPMQDEDDDDSTKIHKSSPVAPQISFQKPPPEVPQISFNKPPPQIPQFSLINKRSEKKPTPKKPPPRQFTSPISEDKAKEEIDRLQKGILVLQTEKEFIKSSYESGIAKYWEIEKKITEMQEQVCFLQDEFSSSAVIEDDEARALMSVAALKSCKDTLVNLQEQQKRSIEETIIESERIKVAKEKLKALKHECGQLEKELGEISDENTGTSPPITTMEEEACNLQQESLQLWSTCENVKDSFEISSDASTVELAEKIDELVNKVINLELTVSSQTAHIQRLRSETDDLQKHLQSMEEEKSCLIYENILSGKLKQAEEDLHQIQHLEKHVKYEKNMLDTNFREACRSLSDISENLQSPKHKDQVKIAEILQSPKHQDQVKIADPSPSQEDRSRLNIEQRKETEEEEASKFQDTKDNVEDNTLCPKDQENQVQLETVPQLGNVSGKFQTSELEDEIVKESLQANDSNHLSSDSGVQYKEQDDAPNLQQLLLNGLEDREKILLAEYTSILRNYKETKRKLFELEKKNTENFSETMSQVRELKNANATKDEEILSLRQILRALQTTTNSKLQNSEMSEDLNLEGTAKKDTSSTVQDRESLNAEEDINPYHVNAPQIASPIEEKFRRDIDTLLDENLEFWLRFSSSFHQIQRFQTEFQSLQTDIDKLKDRKVHEGSSSASEHAAKPESAPIDKQLRELKTELQVWVEQNALLRGELQSRFSSLCNIQEEILGVLKANSEADVIQFTPYHAAKFQGEVLNMKQENNKVADELQAGLDHVRGLQVEVEKTMSALSKLHEKIELSSSKSGHHHNHHFRHFSSKNRVPLRSFLYGVKSKKPSIFACMNPALQKQYSDLRAGMPI